jgi:mannose-6-phosphate isomerase-like protein (cupin superfamily)
MAVEANIGVGERVGERGSGSVGSSPTRAARRPTGYRLVSKPTGEEFAFVASARSAADKKFRFVWTLAPGKKGPGEHHHEAETEVFEIVSGTVRIWSNGVARDYGPGEVCVVPPGVRHRFLNAGPEPVVIDVSLDGPRMEDALVPVAVATAGREARSGDLLRMVAGLDAWPSVPASAVARAVIGATARLLRALGFAPYPPALGWDTPDPAS